MFLGFLQISLGLFIFQSINFDLLFLLIHSGNPIVCILLNQEFNQEFIQQFQ